MVMWFVIVCITVCRMDEVSAIMTCCQMGSHLIRESEPKRLSLNAISVRLIKLQAFVSSIDDLHFTAEADYSADYIAFQSNLGRGVHMKSQPGI
jgi:hypothetical protein